MTEGEPKALNLEEALQESHMAKISERVTWLRNTCDEQMWNAFALAGRLDARDKLSLENLVEFFIENRAWAERILDIMGIDSDRFYSADYCEMVDLRMDHKRIVERRLHMLEKNHHDFFMERVLDDSVINSAEFRNAGSGLAQFFMNGGRKAKQIAGELGVIDFKKFISTEYVPIEQWYDAQNVQAKSS